MNILDSLYEERTWQGFLQYKIEKQHLSGKEQKQLEELGIQINEGEKQGM